MDKQMKGTILVALSGVLYGTIGYFGTNLFHAGLSVTDLLLWRFLGSVLLMLPCMPWFFKGAWKSVQWQTLGIAFGLGAVCYGLGTELYFKASFMIGTGLAMVLFFTYPLLVVAYSALHQKKWPSRVTWMSLLLIVVGCFMIGRGHSVQVSWWGIVLAVVSGMSYGIYILVSKKRAHILTPLLSTFMVCLGCVAVFLLELILRQQPFYWPQGWFVGLNILGFSLIGTVLPVLFLLQGVKYISATKTAIISVIEPVTVLAVGMIFLGEPVSWIQALGALVILSSALLIQVARE